MLYKNIGRFVLLFSFRLIQFMYSLMQNQLAGVHFRFGNLDKADSNLKASHALATKLKIVEYSAVSLSNLAIVSLRQKKYHAAMKYSREAVEVISESCAKSSPEVWKLSFYLYTKCFYSFNQM